MDATPIIQSLALKSQQGEASPPLLTDDLDLSSLPANLDDTTLERVEALARSPLPHMIPADERHLVQCLRVMLAVLPRQSADELTGELFVAAYQRMLGKYPNDAISYLADHAMRNCRWFPTIAECLEILSSWIRVDEFTKRKAQAAQIANRERAARQAVRWDGEKRFRGRAVTQSEIDRMTPEMIELGISCGAIVRGEDGKPYPYLLDPEEFVAA